MTKQQERKQVLRAFMQNHYSDERLAALLAHAKDGKLRFYSCCCFIGAATTDALDAHAYTQAHYTVAKRLKGAIEAEQAYATLSFFKESGDTGRQRIIIPIIRAEMKRRELNARKAVSQTQEISTLQEVEVGR